jgi:hypothetical protein
MVVTNIYRTLHGNADGNIGAKPTGGPSIHIDNRSVKKANEDKKKQKKGGCGC